MANVSEHSLRIFFSCFWCQIEERSLPLFKQLINFANKVRQRTHLWLTSFGHKNSCSLLGKGWSGSRWQRCKDLRLGFWHKQRQILGTVRAWTLVVSGYFFTRSAHRQFRSRGMKLKLQIWRETKNKENKIAIVFREKHCGGIAPNWKVVHRNGITVDNRADNLTLIPSYVDSPDPDDSSNKTNKEQSLYWVAIQQLPADPLQEVRESILSVIGKPEGKVFLASFIVVRDWCQTFFLSICSSITQKRCTTDITMQMVK